MGQKLFLPSILLLLGYGFWILPEFKVISAGVAIFLFGMLSLEQGFKAFTGGILENLLRKTTGKLWQSLSFGVVTTTLMQSSSLVSVITISFLSAGLIDLLQGIGIIFGANLGTTTGAWLVAAFGLKVKIAAYAMPMLVFGIILVFQSNKTTKGVGYVLAGIGFLFLGIHYMKEGFESFKDQIDLAQYATPGLKGLLLFTLIGMIATVVMQSSHATLVLIITALASQQISYHNALALAIGANVGTTITAILGSLSANIEGKRLAIAHAVFNLSTGAVAIVLITPLAQFVDWSATWLGIGETDYTLKLSLFHTYFNLLGILLMFPLIHRLRDGLNKHVISRERRRKVELPANKVDKRKQPAKAVYLNQAALQYPDTALKAIIQEVEHLYDNAYGVIAHGLFLHRHHLESEMPIQEVVKRTGITARFTEMDLMYKRYIRDLYAELITFSTLAQSEMNSAQVKEVYALKAASRDLVNAVKDVKHLQKNLVRFMESENPHIREQYNAKRARLAGLLRELYTLQNVTPREEDPELIFGGLRLQLEQGDVLANGTLDQLIRHQHISHAMTSSLMNDSHYSRSIAEHLINTLEVLMTARSSGEGVLTREVALEQEEALELSESEAGLESSDDK